MCHSRRKLPAKRWAIASRWGTEKNECEPTLLAWDTEEEKLDKEDYQALEKILLRTDLDGVLEGLGHREILPQIDVMGGSEAPEDSLDEGELSERVPGDLQIHIGDQAIDPGFAAMVSPFGVYPLHGENDLPLVRQIRDLDLNIAVASLSSRYVITVSQDLTVSQDPHWLDADEGVQEHSVGERFANRAGLTVVWLEAGMGVDLAEE